MRLGIDFEHIGRLRDSLVHSLIEWRNLGSDELWASQPQRGPDSAPSFTCTAICIQALLEAKTPSSRAAAEASASRILAGMQTSGGAFVPLSGEVGSRPHTMNNAWAAFAVLECFPDRAREMRPTIEWLIQSQDNGWWDLVAGQRAPTRYPIFGAYAIVALAQYLKCVKDGIPAAEAERIRASIESGVRELMNQRATMALEHDLLLWNASSNGAQIIGLGTSALCAHAIGKAARVLGKPEWADLVRRTFVQVAETFARRKDSFEFDFFGARVVLWDTVNQVYPINYSWSAFAPLTILTLVRQLTTEASEQNARLYEMIRFFVSWITDHLGSAANRPGVFAGPSTPYVMTWSTAAAAIALSRLIEKQALIAELESAMPDSPAGSTPVALPATKHLVLLVHGINTRARWVTIIRPRLREAGLLAEPAGYGVYGVLRFLLPFDGLRRKAIERVRIRMNAAVAVHKPDQLSVIAHSFGSYVVARLMAAEFNVRWHRVIFCGSVNAQDFPFEQYLDRFTVPIVNEIGTRDILPALAERVTWGYGSLGSHGYLGAAVEERWHNRLGHSDFLEPEFCKKFWIPWLRDGTLVKGDEEPEAPARWARVLLWFPWRWIIVAGLVLSIGLGGTWLTRWLSGSETPYAYNQMVSQERPISDLGTALGLMTSDIEANCRRSVLDRWWRGQRCTSAQLSPNTASLKACRGFRIETSTPEMALRQVAQTFGECLLMDESSAVLSIRVREGRTSPFQAQGERWLLCGCSSDEVQKLKDLHQ